MLKAMGAYRQATKSNTGVITVPADLVKDSQFPLGEGAVEILIVEDHLEVRMCK